LAEAPHSTNELVRYLRSIPIFSDCPEAGLVGLAGACRIRQIPKGSVVFFQSDPSEAVYIVRSGLITILLASPDGREFIINETHPGEIFGELSLITGQTRSSSAVAREKSELLVIPSSAFLFLLENQATVVRRLLEMIALRLYASTTRESALAFLDAPGRLVRILLQLDEQNVEKGYMTTSQEELAQRTGLARQTVAKILGRWRRAGWLITGRGRIMLLNRAALEKVEQQSAG
jgi:CRP-like cAMP-binding protein